MHPRRQVAKLEVQNARQTPVHVRVHACACVCTARADPSRSFSLLLLWCAFVGIALLISCTATRTPQKGYGPVAFE